MAGPGHNRTNRVVIFVCGIFRILSYTIAKYIHQAKVILCVCVPFFCQKQKFAVDFGKVTPFIGFYLYLTGGTDQRR